MILIIDNYDSFTYNLVEYFKILGQKVLVFRNDKISIQQIEDLKPSAIVISPGPFSPNESGICLELMKNFHNLIPILGVCLGHQVIGQFFGCKIIKAKTPMHGKISKIRHYGCKIFQNIKNEFNVARYHSLIIDNQSFCDNLIITSKTNDGIIMSVKHKIFDIYGLQFHPESIATENGMQIIKNFLEIINERNN